MVFLLQLLLALSAIKAATDADFNKLKSALSELYNRDSRMISLVVRLSFHDLLLQRSPQGSGCIQKLSFQRSNGNEGLNSPVDKLLGILAKPELQSANFHFGDVIAFASKIAVETAYPCINIPFKYNRRVCADNAPITTGSGSTPDPNMNKIAQMSPHSAYLGMTDFEFATLTIGAHAINGARANPDVSRWNGIFSTESSGGDYINQTLSRNWAGSSINGRLTFVSGDLIRLPSDMMLFPDAKRGNSLLKRKKGNKKRKPKGPLPPPPPTSPPPPPPVDTAAKNVQEQLRALANQQQAFDDMFATVFAKMLNGGGGSTVYKEDFLKPASCLPRITSTPATSTKTTSTKSTSVTGTVTVTVFSASSSVTTKIETTITAKTFSKSDIQSLQQLLNKFSEFFEPVALS